MKSRPSSPRKRDRYSAASSSFRCPFSKITNSISSRSAKPSMADESSAHRRHQCRGSERMPTMLTEKPGDSAAALQQRHDPIQIHAIDTLDLKRHVLAQYLAHALC